MSNLDLSPQRYGSLFSTNTPQTTPYSSEALERAYAQLEQLKNQTSNVTNNQIQKTVFTELNEELEGLSEDERKFVESSPEFQSLNSQYQSEFSAFLIQYLGNDYLKAGYGKTIEKMLFTIREKKSQYKSKFASDISEIKTQNQSLAQQNLLLEQANTELQNQLKEIQRQLKQK